MPHKASLDQVSGQDLFGHAVNLNFNQSGPKHTTAVGGACSILV